MVGSVTLELFTPVKMTSSAVTLAPEATWP